MSKVLVDRADLERAIDAMSLEIARAGLIALDENVEPRDRLRAALAQPEDVDRKAHDWFKYVCASCGKGFGAQDDAVEALAAGGPLLHRSCRKPALAAPAPAGMPTAEELAKALHRAAQMNVGSVAEQRFELQQAYEAEIERLCGKPASQCNAAEINRAHAAIPREWWDAHRPRATIDFTKLAETQGPRRPAQETIPFSE